MVELIRNCRLCKQPMERSPFMLCMTCLADFEKVKTFTRKNPLVSMEDISHSTNVPIGKVEKMIDLGVELKN
ncbi:hypothetical protein [Virgibacillus kimchii]